MALEPITMDIIFQLMLICFVLTLFGLLLNWILGVKPSKMKEIRDKAFNLRERVRQAEIIGDNILLQQLQLETMQIMKQMLKKQVIPMLIRCVIFLGIFFVISMTYGQYEFWFWYYLLFSFSFSMIAVLLRYGYKRITGKEDKRKIFAKEIMQSIYPGQPSQTRGFLSLPGTPATEEDLNALSDESLNENEKHQPDAETDAWKKRLNNKNPL